MTLLPKDCFDHSRHVAVGLRWLLRWPAAQRVSLSLFGQTWPRAFDPTRPTGPCIFRHQTQMRRALLPDCLHERGQRQFSRFRALCSTLHLVSRDWLIVDRAKLGRRSSLWPLYTRTGECAGAGVGPRAQRRTSAASAFRADGSCVELHCETQWRFLRALRRGGCATRDCRGGGAGGRRRLRVSRPLSRSDSARE